MNQKSPPRGGDFHKAQKKELRLQLFLVSDGTDLLSSRLAVEKLLVKVKVPF
ncbi:hypothetical protein [Paenibacillus sp. 1P03SA]|uniref:hypothetical protein n=1 Tax=Paenibacillus sp. 1P03SA TaxID=3132294 RepID=UPI0039A3075A